MLSEITYCSPDEIRRNAECLLGHIEAVQAYLRKKGFSGHAIDYAVTVVYRGDALYHRHQDLPDQQPASVGFQSGDPGGNPCCES